MTSLVLVLAFSGVSDAALGPPPSLPDRAVEISAEATTSSRRVEVQGTASTARVINSDLEMEQDIYASRVTYALTDEFSIHGIAGVSRVSLGQFNFNPFGRLSMKGDLGPVFGLGADYVFPVLKWTPDITAGLSGQWKTIRSGLDGGEYHADEFRFALKGSKSFDKFLIYGAPEYSVFNGDWRGVTTSSQNAAGTIKQKKRYGFLAGAEMNINDRVGLRLEGELGAVSSMTFSLHYDLVGYFAPKSGGAPKPEPAAAKTTPAVSVAAAASAVNAASQAERESDPGAEEIPASGIMDEPTLDLSRRDVRRAEEEVDEGNRLTSLGRLDEAYAAYRRALELDPGNYRARYNLATLKYQRKNYDEARRYYLEVLRMNPVDVDANLYLGFCHYRLGDLERAGESWRRVLELDPGNTLALNNLQALRR